MIAFGWTPYILIVEFGVRDPMAAIVYEGYKNQLREAKILRAIGGGSREIPSTVDLGTT